MPKRPSGNRRVLMTFFCRRGWQVSFLEADCCTSLPRKLTFATADKLFEMHQRWGENKSDAAVSDLEREIEMGRPGSIWLLLSEEQYQLLKLPKAPAAAATNQTSRAASA